MARTIVVYQKQGEVSSLFRPDDWMTFRPENFVRDYAPVAAVGFGAVRGEPLALYYLEEAFRRTNTVDRPWWENERVTALFVGEGCRSTSVGDVLYDCASGIYWMVKALGFKRIYPEEVGDVEGT